MKWVSLRFICCVDENRRRLREEETRSLNFVSFSFFSGEFLFCFITPLLWRLLMITHYFLWSFYVKQSTAHKKSSFVDDRKMFVDSGRKFINYFFFVTRRQRLSISFNCFKPWCNCVNIALFTLHARLAFLLSLSLTRFAVSFESSV